MKKLILLFSHRLTPVQEGDARKNLGIASFVSLPKDLQEAWSQVPPGLDSLEGYQELFVSFLSKNATVGDYVLIQGDFGLTYLMVREARALGLVPVYATTRRESSEIQEADGSVKKTVSFRHVRFRVYG